MVPTTRRLWLVGALLAGLVVVVVLGRSVIGSPQLTPSPIPTELAGYGLAGLPADLEQNPRCAGVGVGPLVLHGALLGDSAQVWVTTNKNAKLQIMWPSAFRARFEPGLVVLTGDGAVIAREGETLPDAWPDYQICTESLVLTPGGPIDVLVLPIPTPTPA